jgi:hypothetical protein
MYLVDRIKEHFHRDLVADPVTHGWVINLYLNGERYPQRVTDYFQSEFAPDPALAENTRHHSRDEAKHVQLFAHALEMLDQPVVELESCDVFNHVIRSLTPGTFHIAAGDPAELQREKLANFMAHAHFLEKRIERSFAYHRDACEAMKRDRIARVVSAVHADEARHVGYTRAAVFDLLPRRRAREVLELHRRVEARANLLFSQAQVKVFLAKFAAVTPAQRQLLYRVSAFLMEGAGHVV